MKNKQKVVLMSPTIGERSFEEWLWAFTDEEIERVGDNKLDTGPMSTCGHYCNEEK